MPLKYLKEKIIENKVISARYGKIEVWFLAPITFQGTRKSEEIKANATRETPWIEENTRRGSDLFLS